MKFIKGLCLLLLTITLCACSVLGDIASTSSQSSGINSVAVSIDTGGKLVAMQSENVLKAGYDLSSQKMIVHFRNGSEYWYQPVPPSVWTEFYLAQPHPWSKVGYPKLVVAGVPYGHSQ